MVYNLIQNPIFIDSTDDLFDLFDQFHAKPTKFVCGMKSSPMKIQNKILRKAFYENSSNFENTIQFVEINNSRVGSVIGLKSPSDIVLIQPKNEFNEYGTKYRLFN
jgi:hypothetical protein